MLNRIVKRMSGDTNALKKAPLTTTSRIKKLHGGERSGPQFSSCGDTLGAMLTSHDRRPEKVRLGGEWIHVSALVNGECLRAVQIASKEKLDAKVRPRPSDRLLWAIGKAVEAHIRESMIDMYGRHNVLGQWECRCGGLKYTGIGNDKKCKVCSGLATKYFEYHILNEETMLSGSPDLLIRKKEKAPWTVAEIKSIKVVGKGGVRNATPEFHTIMAPVRNHSLQVLSYQRLLRMNGVDVTDDTLVCYGAKDYVMESPYKFFTLDAESPENVMAVDYLFDLAKEYRSAITKKKLLPRIGLCSSCTTTKAKGCPCVTSCFSSRS